MKDNLYPSGHVQTYKVGDVIDIEHDPEFRHGEDEHTVV